jgi:hypothetical protein
MADPLFDVRQGRRVYTASGTITAGMVTNPHTTAGQVVAAVAKSAGIMTALTDATTGTDVEVMPITRGAEYRFLANASISAGAEVEVSSTAGRVAAFTDGVKIGRAQEAAASGGLVKVIAY